MRIIRDVFRIADPRMEGERSGPLRLSDRVGQALAYLMGWSPTGMRRIRCGDQGQMRIEGRDVLVGVRETTGLTYTGSGLVVAHTVSSPNPANLDYATIDDSVLGSGSLISKLMLSGVHGFASISLDPSGVRFAAGVYHTIYATNSVFSVVYYIPD